MDNYKFTGSKVPTRAYPSNKVKHGNRYVLIRGSHISFPAFYHYHQYLVSVLLPVVLGSQILTDSNDKSAYRQLIINHIRWSISGPQYAPVRATNADTYLISTANDIELMFINGLLTQALLKRLKSKSDGEMRGALFEIAIAASLVRAGYEIIWLVGNARPEFSATKGLTIDVEAKRRNRTGKNEYELEKEIRAIRQNLAKALEKKRENPYIIFLDSDIPPRSSKDNEVFYSRCKKEFEGYNLEKAVVLITNSGYENDQGSIETGKNSVMVHQGPNSLSEKVIEAIILSMHAKIPDAISSDWPVS